MKLDHIGIAVESIAHAKSFYEILGLGAVHIEDVLSEKVQTGMFTLDNGARIELLESTDPNGVIAKYLAKRGPGIHHICIRVDDIKNKVQQLVKAGIRMVDEVPKKGANNCLVAFIHPQATGGVLIELSEKM